MTTSNNAPHAPLGPRSGERTERTHSKDVPSAEPATNVKRHRQKLALYHPNSMGNGAAMQLEPRLNRTSTDRYNCFFMEMAAQRSVAVQTSERETPASFDWANKLTVKLDFADVCEILTVLEGRVDKLGGQRSGLFHKSSSASTIISLQKADRGGFFLGLSKKDTGSESSTRIVITLTEAEAIGLRSIFQTGLFFIMYHSHIFQQEMEPSP